MAPRYRPVPAESNVTSPFGPRWGTQHRGTDFGKAGGSANMPVYAAQGGTVVYAGAASGFGGPDPAGWLVVDHPAADGAGTTVYGHIIREVSQGQRVEAGQRIGRVNPNQGTNGNVAPHLHFEVHPYSWLQGSQIDPIPWLGNAPSPGEKVEENMPANIPSTLFGVDVSEHQDGMSLRRAKDEGIEFAILRLCDGTHVDRTFQSHLDDAESAGLLVSTYWYLRAPSEGTTIAQQVDVIDRQMNGRRDLGVWIDVESVGPGGQKLLTEQDVWSAKRELESRGYHVPGIYSGAWYWERMPGGEPSMGGLGYLWVSHYGPSNARGAYRAIYRGDHDTSWSYPLGDRKPDILQYGSNGLVAGWYVDVNAFRGSREELAGIFHPGNTTAARPAAPEQSFLEELMSQVIESYIQPGKTFPAPTAMSLIDASTWRTEVLSEALLQALGIDTERVLAAAIEADNTGGDRTAAIRRALNLKES